MKRITNLTASSIIVLLCLISATSFAHKVSKDVRHAFEHKYSTICIDHEVKNANNKAMARRRFTDLCNCIAKDLSTHLTLKEVQKFNRENKYPQSLRIRAEAAVYECRKKKNIKNIKSPTIFKRR